MEYEKQNRIVLKNALASLGIDIGDAIDRAQMVRSRARTNDEATKAITLMLSRLHEANLWLGRAAHEIGKEGEEWQQGINRGSR